jgi:heme exporter protein B
MDEFHEIGRAVEFAWLIAKRDLRIELRTRDALVTAGYFGVLVVLLFAFAFQDLGPGSPATAAGMLWVALVFSGALTLNRIFERERRDGGFVGLLLAPSPRGGIYLGKVAATVIMMVVSQLLLSGAVLLLTSVPITLPAYGAILGVLTLGTLGYACLGCLLNGMLIRTRDQETLLTLILFPLMVPNILLGMQATELLLDPNGPSAAIRSLVEWLCFFDLVFVLVGLWMFEALVLE